MQALFKHWAHHFVAVTVSPEQGTIDRRGIVYGDSVVVTYQWRERGWLTVAGRDYSFYGTIVK